MTTLRRRLSWPAGANGKWLLCAGLALAATALTCWPGGLAWLRYDRAALIGGQYWRAASAHLVHLNGVHLLLNLAGLFLLCELLWNDLPLRHGAGLLAVSAAVTSALLFWLDPALAWYAGLSGALHGLWAGCALAGMTPRIRSRTPFSATPTSSWRRIRADWPLSRSVSLAGLALLLAKLVLETCFGAAVQTGAAIGAPVVTSAHVYGAFGGAIYVLAWRAWPAQSPVRALNRPR